MLTEKMYQDYVSILKEELIPALGCTEPIAIAYASATARDALGGLPERIELSCSGNIIKNVKGVVVPTTKDMKGMAAAAIIGAVGGRAEKKLEVLSDVNQADLALAKELLARNICEEKLLSTPAKLHIVVRMWRGGDTSMAEIIHSHSNVVRIEKNGQVLLDVPHSDEEQQAQTDRSCLNVEDIYAFAQRVALDDVGSLLETQIAYNTAISDEGLKNNYGAGIGRTLLGLYGDDVKIRARACAAAGSDARMSGCEMPVVINSGSGNQGITVSVPVVEYAKSLHASREQLLRALCLSNLVAIHQKAKIGRLSAYCGAVNAAAGACAGITYLLGGSLEQISSAVTIALGDVSGIVCDGAKPSCAAKISSSLDAAIMAAHMAMNNSRGFESGEGLVMDGIEHTIDSISRLAKDGMEVTDTEILHIMMDGSH